MRELRRVFSEQMVNQPMGRFDTSPTHVVKPAILRNALILPSNSKSRHDAARLEEARDTAACLAIIVISLHGRAVLERL